MKIINKKGFSLIELIIYIGLAVIILNISIFFIWRLVESRSKISAYQEVERNANFVLDKISYEAKRAESIIIPANQGDQTNELLLVMPGGYQSHFYLSENRVLFTNFNNPNSIFLTNDQVIVEEFIFQNFSGAEPGIFQTKIKIIYKNPSGRNEKKAEISVQKSINLRDN